MSKARGRITQKIPSPFPQVDLVQYENRPYWFIRIYSKATGQYSIRSTETVDSERASRLIPEIYQKYLADPDGLKRENTLSILQLMDAFVEHQKRRADSHQIVIGTYQSKKNVMENGIRSYVMSYRILKVDDLDNKTTFLEYPTHRLNQNIKRSTIAHEIRILREWVKWMYSTGHIRFKDITVELPRQIHAVRDREHRAYTDDEVIAMSEWFTNKISSTTGDSQYRWRMVWMFISLMLDSGGRTDEIYNLNFGDCSIRSLKNVADVETCIEIRVSKTGPRTTICLSPVVPILKELIQSKGHTVKKDTPLWWNPLTGNRVRKTLFTEFFNEAKKDLGLEGMRLYDFRATHINDALTRVGSPNLYLIAKNIGTSVAMIQRYYESIQLRDHAAIITERRDEDTDKFRSVL